MITTILVGTYAWFTWSSTDNTVFNMTIGEIANVTFEGGNAIEGELAPVFNYSDGLSTSFSIINSDTSGSDVLYSIKFNITSIDTALINNATDIKYTILKNNTVIKNGNLAGADNNKSITLYSGKLDNGTASYKIYLYIDGNVENDISMMGKTLTGNIIVGEGYEMLSEHITNLYLNNKDSEPVENNGISYGYASIYDNDSDTDPDNITSGGLMNDRLGNKDVGIDAGNVRYYGANPNNYIYFNCNDYSSQSEDSCELWRIIGVFDGKVKIMKNTIIGSLAWDQDKNHGLGATTYNNDWSNSSLQEFLNGKYYDRGEDTTYTYYNGSDNGSDGSSSVSINLENIGIKNDETRGLISETLWYLRGWTNTVKYSDQMYDYERNSGNVYNTSWSTVMPGNIAIPYVSDYGYAADFGSCNIQLCSYGDTICSSANWMKPILGTSSYGWLMAPYLSISGQAWDVYSSGYVGNNYVYNAHGVAPVLHLNSELGIKTGNGSQDTPYQIAIG